MTFQPAAASARVVASPMPLLAPVITATEGMLCPISVTSHIQLDDGFARDSNYGLAQYVASADQCVHDGLSHQTRRLAMGLSLSDCSI